MQSFNISSNPLNLNTMTVLGKASQLTSVERKDKLKPALNENLTIFCDNGYTTSDYLFGRNISESLKLAKEYYKLAQNLANNDSTPRHKSSESSNTAGYDCWYDAEVSSSYSSSTRTSLNYQNWKKTLSSLKPRNSKFKKN